MPENATELLERPAGESAVTGIAAPVTGSTEAGGTQTGDVETGEVVAADLLVEEISIDGMCGVY